ALFFLVALVAAVASIVNSLCTTRKHSKMAKENTDSSPSTPPKEDGELLCSEAVEEALWRKSIIMGERCRPLVFSGQILYDSQGNQLPNLAPVVPPRGGQHQDRCIKIGDIGILTIYSYDAPHFRLILMETNEKENSCPLFIPYCAIIAKLTHSVGKAMAIGLLHAVTALVSAWSRNMSRAARKLSRRRSSFIPSFRGKKKERDGGFGDEDTEGELEEEMQGEDGVWRRTILMGEKCQPLDFSGVIYYDADGRQLAEVPTPRSPLRSPLPSFAQKSPVTAGYVC
ncbi:unnamed protein product, partial [Musa acuminata subsp. burmannicoides]